MKSAGRYILIGTITAAPLIVTWIILSFLFNLLARAGLPWVTGIASRVAPDQPVLAAWLRDESLLSVVAALLVLGILWLLGWGASRVIGQRMILIFEWVIERIPFVEKVYQATKRFLTITGNSSNGGDQRVVLIEFPSPEMKAIGLVTRIMKDDTTGEELAAVYVPTSPNPTSGYIEIVPTRRLTFTDWTFDQAMSFVITGGSNAPDTITYYPKPKKDETSPAAPAVQGRDTITRQ